MKSCKLIVLILFLIPVILPGFTVVEASESELLELLSSGPYITSWEAVDADSVLSGDPSILGTAPLELLVRWGSGLLIQADGDLSNIEIHEKFISSHNESFALVETVKVPEHQFIEPGKLTFPDLLAKNEDLF